MDDKQLRQLAKQLNYNYDGAVAAGIPRAQITQYLSAKVQKKNPDTMLNKVAGGLDTVFGGGTIGEAIGTFAAKSGLTGLNEQERGFVSAGPSAKEIAGDVASTALGAVPFLKAGATALRTGGVLARAGKGALLGGGIGAAEDIENGGNGSGAISGAALGAGMPIVGAGLRAAGKYLTIDAPEILINRALGVKSKMADKGIYEAFNKRGLAGKTLEDIVGITSKEADLAEKEINSILKKTVKTQQVDTQKALDLFTRKLRASTGASLTTEQLKKRIQSFSPDFAKILNKKKISLVQLNNLRSAIDKNLKEATFLGKELTAEQSALKSFTNDLRELIQKQSGTQKQFKGYSESLRLQTLAEEAIKKDATQGIASIPGILGGVTGSLLGGVPGLVGGAAIGKIASTAPVMTGAARILQAANVPEEIIERFNKVSPAAQQEIIRVLFGD